MTIENVEKLYRYLRDAIPANDYARRRKAIFDYYEQALRTGRVLVNRLDQRFVPLDYNDDLAMYYLFQVELYTEHYVEYDAAFIARLLPKLEVIGSQLDALVSAKNFDLSVEKLLRPKQRSVESTLFEMITACLYIRNGYRDIEFIKEAKEKRPDLRANDLFVECKRKAKECDYALRERKAWHRLYAPVSTFLFKKKLPLVVDVTFKHEVATYPHDYLFSIVRDMLTARKVDRLDNESITVTIRPSQLSRYNAERTQRPIRMDRPLFTSLLFDYDAREGGITSELGLRYDRHMYKISPLVDFASAGIWHSLSPEAMRSKAVSMKSNIEKAIKQIPAYRGANIHVCYESYEGTIVEQQILDRAVAELGSLNEEYREISAMYIHVVRPHLDDLDDSVVDEYTLEVKIGNTHVLADTHLFNYA